MAVDSESTEVRIGVDIPVDAEMEELSVQHERVKRIENLEIAVKLKKLAIIASAVTKIEGLESNVNLEHLEMYQAVVADMGGISHLTNLVTLDLSFNKIKKIEGLENLTKLERLYLSSNKISVMECLSSLSNLRLLELGSNRIRDISGLDGMPLLSELWLGKNKISRMDLGSTLASPLIHLRKVSLQSNRLTEWDSNFFINIPSLTHLYLGCNALPDIPPEVAESVPSGLVELDLASNKLTRVPLLPNCKKLAELWMNDNLVESNEGLNNLSNFPQIRTVYIERNKVHSDCPLDCRNAIIALAPTITQIDATIVPQLQTESTVFVRPSQNAVKSILKKKL